MDYSRHPSSLNCELRIIHAKNIEAKPKGVVFVRCYLHAGRNSRVRIDSKEMIPSKSNSDITWNQTFSLDCWGTQESIEELKQETLVFELRWRSTASPFIGKIQGSRLISRAEVSWEDGVDDTASSGDEKWVVMSHKKPRVCNDIIDPTELLISVRLEECTKTKTKIDSLEKCGCNSCVDYELFAIEAALEVL